MEDLNNLHIFALVVEQNGFTGAARVLGISRSNVCRRMSQLEEELGVRLIQRSTRRFAVTDIGMEFYGYCARSVIEARAGFDRVACVKGKPTGLIRVSCSAAILQLVVGPLIPLFTSKHPEVRIAVEVTNRKVDIDDPFDLSIRLCQIPSEDSRMVMRSLGVVPQVWVASREFVERHGQPSRPEEASGLRTLCYGSFQGPHVWKVMDRSGQETAVRIEPVLIVDDHLAIKQAALQGVGIAQLPLPFCVKELRDGSLQSILSEYVAPRFELQLVYPSRRGVLPAVRSFIDFLAAHSIKEIKAWEVVRPALRHSAA